MWSKGGGRGGVLQVEEVNNRYEHIGQFHENRDKYLLEKISEFSQNFWLI